MPQYNYRCPKCGFTEFKIRQVDARNTMYSGGCGHYMERTYDDDPASEGVHPVRFIGAGTSSRGFDHIPTNDSFNWEGSPLVDRGRPGPVPESESHTQIYKKTMRFV